MRHTPVCGDPERSQEVTCQKCEKKFPNEQEMAKHVCEADVVDEVVDEKDDSTFAIKLEVEDLEWDDTTVGENVDEEDEGEADEAVEEKVGKMVGGDWRCKDCDRTFKSSRSLKMHARYCRHDGLESKTPEEEKMAEPTPTLTSSSSTLKLKCVLCRAVFFGAEELRLHGIEHHKNERDFHCNWCSANFRLKTDLIRHALETHHSEKKLRAKQSLEAKKSKTTYLNETDFIVIGGLRTNSIATSHDHNYLQSAKTLSAESVDGDGDSEPTHSVDDDERDVIDHEDDEMDVDGEELVPTTSKFNPNVPRIGNFSSDVSFCPICKKFLRNAITLQLHMEKVHNITFCVFCRKKVRRLNLHLKNCSKAPTDLNSSGQILKSCSECKLSFDNVTDLLLHLKNEHTNNHCEFCLDVVNDLSDHLVTCAQVPGRERSSKLFGKTETCPVCSKTFPMVALLRLHVSVSHQLHLCIFCKEAVRVIKLHVCKNKAADAGKYSAAAGVIAKVGSKLNLEVCWECKKYFSSAEKLEQHMEDDHGADYCRFCKTKVEDPEIHLEACSKNTDLCCKVCSQEFDNFEDLKKHNDLVHEQVRNFCVVSLLTLGFFTFSQN